jgi:plasmid stabilization system protein ParE
LKEIRFLAAARRELLAEITYYNESGRGLGAKFAGAFEKALTIAAQFPKAGSQGPAATRKVMVKGFPFSVVYLEEAPGIVVVAVAHHARRPGYWIGRLS